MLTSFNDKESGTGNGQCAIERKTRNKRNPLEVNVLNRTRHQRQCVQNFADNHHDTNYFINSLKVKFFLEVRKRTSTKMYIIRCLSVAFLVTSASAAQPNEDVKKRESLVDYRCRKPHAAYGVAWFDVGCALQDMPIAEEKL